MSATESRTTPTAGAGHPPGTARGPTRRQVVAGLVLGVGFGGFVDGIVLHQILQWHHMLTNTGHHPADTVAGLEANTVAHGLFHATTWICLLVGVALVRRAWATGEPGPSIRTLVGTMLTGWGLFNLVEGLIDHHLLGVHNVRDDVADPLWRNLGLLAFGALLVVAGLRAGPPPFGGGVRGLARRGLTLHRVLVALLVLLDGGEGGVLLVDDPLALCGGVGERVTGVGVGHAARLPGTRRSETRAPPSTASTGSLEPRREELRHEDTGVTVTQVMPAAIATPFFEHARTRLGVRPSGPPPVCRPERVADAIVHAAEHGGRDLTVGGAAQVQLAVQRLSPRIMGAVTQRVAFRVQRSDEPKGPTGDIVDEPLRGDDRVRGNVTADLVGPPGDG
jgi:uncharacterized membrane protein